MPVSGVVALAIEDPTVDAMERTHHLARTILAPDLADRDYIRTHAEDGKTFPATHSASHARALGEAARHAAKQSLQKRRVPGWCKNGHELTPENKEGRQCLICKRQWQRDSRAKRRAA